MDRLNTCRSRCFRKNVVADLNHSDIAELVRRRFNGPEGDELRYIPLVDPALRQLSYDVARDPGLRHWLMTDPTTTTATLDGNGVADLTALIADPRILLECLQYGNIFPPVNVSLGYSTQPFRLIDNTGQMQLAGNYDALVFKATLDGFELKTKSADNNATPLAGTISFEVPYWPTLAQLPNSLVQKLVWGNYWVTGEPKSENAAV